MLPLEFSRRWRIASAILLLAVLAAAIMPAVWFWPDRGRLDDLIGGLDKWAHAGTFAALAIWFSGQYRVRSYWRIAIGLLAFGLLIEACQRMVTYRTAEWHDVVADAVDELGRLGRRRECSGPGIPTGRDRSGDRQVGLVVAERLRDP